MKLAELLEKVITELQDYFGTPEALLWDVYSSGDNKFRPRALFALRDHFEDAWSFRTTYCDDYSDAMPKSYGQCYVTARALNLIFGWAILCNRRNGNNHYWNKLPTGQEIDFTSDQMGGDGILPTSEFEGTGKIRKFKPLQQCTNINSRLKTYLEALLFMEERFVKVFHPDADTQLQHFFEKHPNARQLTQEECQREHEARRSFHCLLTYSL